MAPWRRLSPDWSSVGTSPSQEASLRGLSKRPKSPISSPSRSAESVSMPRKQRETLVECLPAGDQAVDGGQRVEVRELARRLLEALPREPLAMEAVPGG